jgi:hypothetical protein
MTAAIEADIGAPQGLAFLPLYRKPKVVNIPKPALTEQFGKL